MFIAFNWSATGQCTCTCTMPSSTGPSNVTKCDVQYNLPKCKPKLLGAQIDNNTLHVCDI